MKKMKDSEYFAIDKMSTSSLKRFAKSPAHYMTPFNPTSSMNTGTLIHTAILEPEVFVKKYVVERAEFKGMNKNNKEYKEWKGSMIDSGKEIVSQDDLDMIEQIKLNLSIMKYEDISLLELLEQSQRELALFGTINDIEFKGKLDAINENYKVLIDLKTCQDSEFFYHDARKLKYNWQAWIYRELYLQNTLDCFDFLFITIETKKPYGCRLFLANDDTYNRAGKQVNNCLDRYKAWIDDNKPYRVYSDDVSILDI